MVQAFESGQYRRALRWANAAANQPEAPATLARTARLVRALARVRLGRWEAAAAAIATLEKQGPSLGSYGRYLRTRAHRLDGDCTAAAEAAATLPSTSVFRADAWAQVAHCWLQRAHGVSRPTGPSGLASARAAVEQMAQHAASAGEHAQRLWLAARLAEQDGEAKQAATHYRTLISNHPSRRSSHRARRRLRRIRHAPGALEQPRSRWLRGAEAASARGHRWRARKLYRRVLRDGARPRRATQARLGLVELDIVQQRYGWALARLDKVLVDQPPAAAAADSRALLAQAWYLKGDVLSRKGFVRRALRAFATAPERFPEQPFSVQAALAGARLAYTISELERSRELARWVLKHPADSGATTVVSGDGARQAGTSSRAAQARAHWLLGWMAHHQQAFSPAAREHWQAIARDGPLGPAALYWRIKAALARDQLERAEELAGELVEAAPTTHYALAAADLLEQVRPSVQVGWQPPSRAAQKRPLRDARDLRAAVVLFEHGLREAAWEVVHMQPATVLSRADRIVAAWLYQRTGDVYRAAIITRRATLAEAQTLRDPMLFALAYPRPFRPAVRRVARRYGLPPTLLYAVMRHESSFNAQAVSPRGARGLMQMMPTTARRMAREVGWRWLRPRHLFKPYVSLRLGAHYLAGLLDLFDGNLVATLTAYHAGEARVQRWLRERPGMQTDAFLEDIPFSTTRDYVKKVLSSLGVYRLLYASPPNRSFALQLDRVAQRR